MNKELLYEISKDIYFEIIASENEDAMVERFRDLYDIDLIELLEWSKMVVNQTVDELSSSSCLDEITKDCKNYEEGIASITKHMSMVISTRSWLNGFLYFKSQTENSNAGV